MSWNDLLKRRDLGDLVMYDEVFEYRGPLAAMRQMGQLIYLEVYWIAFRAIGAGEDAWRMWLVTKTFQALVNHQPEVLPDKRVRLRIAMMKEAYLLPKGLGVLERPTTIVR